MNLKIISVNNNVNVNKKTNTINGASKKREVANGLWTNTHGYVGLTFVAAQSYSSFVPFVSSLKPLVLTADELTEIWWVTTLMKRLLQYIFLSKSWACPAMLITPEYPLSRISETNQPEHILQDKLDKKQPYHSNQLSKTYEQLDIPAQSDNHHEDW